MKQFLLPLLAMVTCVSANAVHLRKVTSADKIADGGTYVIVSAHASGNRVLKLAESGPSFVAYTDAADLKDSACRWTFSQVSGSTCPHSAYGSTDQHSGAIFNIVQDGKYLQHNNSATSFTTSASGNDATNYYDFIKFSSANSNLSADETYFGLMRGWYRATIFNAYRPNLVLGVNVNTGALAQWTRSDADFNIENLGSSNLYGTNTCYFQLFAVTPDIDELKATYSEQIVDRAAAYGVKFAVDSYIDEINALTGETDEQLDAAEAAMAAIVEQCNADQSAAVVSRFNGNLFTIQNCGTDSDTGISGYYMGGSNTVNTAYGQIFAVRGTEPSRNYVWRLAASGNVVSGITLHCYSPFTALYLGTQLSSTNRRVLMAEMAESYELTPNAADGSKFLLHQDNLYVRNNSTDEIVMSDDAKYLTDDCTNWQIVEVTDQQKDDIYTATQSDIDATLGDKAEGTGLGEYTVTPSLAAMSAEFAEFAANDQFCEAAHAYLAVIDTEFATQINVPQSGRYIHINRYDDEVSDDDANEIYSLMWFTDEGIVDYANGFYLLENGEFCTDGNIAGNSQWPVSFAEGSTSGRYTASTPGSVSDLQLAYATALPVNIGANGLATLCVPVAVTVPEGVSCFVCKVDAANLVISKVDSGDKFAPHTPILVHGEAGSRVKFEIAESGSDDYVSTSFTGNVAKRQCAIAEGTVVYAPVSVSALNAPRLIASDTEIAALHFVQQTAESVLPANAPILTVDQSRLGGAEAVASFAIELNPAVSTDNISLVGVVTSISEISAEIADEAPVYNLQGRRVSSANAPGLYIQAGRKQMRR